MFGLLPFVLLFILLLPALVFLFYFNVAAISFTKLGLSPEGAVLLFGLSLLGSVVNIPVVRKRVIIEDRSRPFFPFLFYYPPQVREQVIAVNFGGSGGAHGVRLLSPAKDPGPTGARCDRHRRMGR